MKCVLPYVFLEYLLWTILFCVLAITSKQVIYCLASDCCLFVFVQMVTPFQVCQSVFEEFPELARLSRTQAYRALSDPKYSGKMKVSGSCYRFLFIVQYFLFVASFFFGMIK